MAKDKKKVSNVKPASKLESGEGKTCAILAYFLVGIIWYFTDEKIKKNSLAKFHTKQALVLLIFGVILSIAASILGLFGIPIIGWVLMKLLSLGIFALWVLGIINAVNGNEKPLPVIGHFAEKLNF